MSDKNLEAADDLRQRDRSIILPLLDCLHVVDEDDKVVLLALVVHLRLVSVSARHDGCFVL